MRLFALTVLGLSFGGGCANDHDDDVVDCAKETRDDNFVIGFEKMGDMARHNFKLVSTTPGVQIGGDNEWVIQINAVTNGVVGDPTVGANLSVTPFMPDHMHVSPSSVVVEPQPAAGQYKLFPVNTWMPGLWETTIQVTGATGDKVVFKTCIPS